MVAPIAPQAKWLVKHWLLANGQWQRSVSTNLTDTVGVLNAIAGRTGNSRLDYSGVCNDLASTTQLPAAQALRGIST
jgi:hypothetical protein